MAWIIMGFEGTGKQYKPEWLPTKSGVKRERENLWDATHYRKQRGVWTGSFVANFIKGSSTPARLKKYFPGPNIQGSNCDDIFRDAKKWFEKRKNFGDLKICLVGYSRGGYIAMCFAKYLKSQKLDVDYMGLFDPVSRDASMVVYRTLQVESNVKSVRVAFRSPKIGSRRTSMNRIALDSTVGKPVHRRECPGSHGALGGFPNGAGTLDKPHWGQGHPEYPTKFHPEKEFTAWWQSGHFISEGAKKQEVPVKSLVPDERARFCLPRSEWYTTVEYKDTVTRREPHRPRM